MKVFNAYLETCPEKCDYLATWNLVSEQDNDVGNGGGGGQVL